MVLQVMSSQPLDRKRPEAIFGQVQGALQLQAFLFMLSVLLAIRLVGAGLWPANCEATSQHPVTASATCAVRGGGRVVGQVPDLMPANAERSRPGKVPGGQLRSALPKEYRPRRFPRSCGTLLCQARILRQSSTALWSYVVQQVDDRCNWIHEGSYFLVILVTRVDMLLRQQVRVQPRF